jgi:integron integrase
MPEQPITGGPEQRYYHPPFVPGRSSRGNTSSSSTHHSLPGDGRAASPLPGQKPKLLDQVREAIRTRHYSLRTETAYVGWIKRFIFFHGKRHPRDMGEREVSQFLSALAVQRHVSASTQSQALSALLFLYREILGQEFASLQDVVRAKRPERVPVVLSRPEVRALLNYLHSEKWLIATILYGAGLRLMECLRLRVKDIDFARNQIIVREGKGNKDRLTMLPAAVKDPLAKHLALVRKQHEGDVAKGFGRVYLPDALARKYPTANREWGWQWVFPASQFSVDPRSGERRRHHLHDSVLHRAIKEAAHKTGLTKPVSCHTLRHAFATHVLEDGYDIRTIQELLGHKDVSTTMIYAHVLNRGGQGVYSPADRL